MHAIARKKSQFAEIGELYGKFRLSHPLSIRLLRPSEAEPHSSHVVPRGQALASRQTFMVLVLKSALAFFSHHFCKVVWSPTLHCRPMWMNLGAGTRLYCYIYGLKSLTPINGLKRLLALAPCDCLHCKRRFRCELSQRIITNRWRHGRHCW